MRRSFSYANVAATLALVFSMSGGALAAKHYLVSSTKQISPKALRSLEASNTKLFNRLAAKATVSSAAFATAAGSAASAGSASNATNATNAANAATVGGLTVRKIFFKAPEGTGETAILSMDGLELIAGCPAGKAVLTARSLLGKSDAHLTFGTPSDTEAHSEGDSVFEAGDTLDALAGTKRGTGELVDLLDNGTSVTVDYAVDDTPSLGDFHGCVFGGVAIAG